MTTGEVGKLLGVNPDRVLDYIHKGWLPSKMVPNHSKNISERHDVTEEGLAQFYEVCEKKMGVATAKYPGGHTYWVLKSNPKVRVNYHRKMPPAEQTLEAKVERLCYLLEVLLEQLGYKAA